MSANLSAVPKLQFFDNNGNPLVGGKLYTYAAGTTTPQATFTDASATTPNTNPIILDSRGEANVWLSATTYKFVLTDAADATIWTVDNISNSLSLSQILAASGSAASPPYTFASDTDTGMYLAAVGQLGLTVAGTPVLRSTDTQMVIGQSGGSNDVDVIVYGDIDTEGDFNLDGAFNLDGNLNITGTARRITGDFSNATVADRVMFQTSTMNAVAVVGVLPNGTANISAFNAYNNSNPTNASYAQLVAFSTDVRVNSDKHGSGSYLPMTFLTGGSERVRIDTSGNVGIGSTSPSVALDVLRSGDAVQIQASNGTVGQRVGYCAFGAAYSGSSSNHPYALLTNDVERMRIDTSGNVGIGTSSPQGILHVVGSGSASANNWVYLSAGNVGGQNPNSALAAGLAVGNNFSNGNAEANLVWGQAIGSGQYFSISKWTGSAVTEQMRITAAGNVGIGTTTPNDKLDIASGNIRLSSGNVVRWVDSGVVRAVVSADASSNLKLETAGTERMRIAADGAQSSVIPSGSTLYPQFACRAWINFDGTSGSIGTGRGSGNVSSVTDNGTGDYTVNFSTAMPDTNYAVVGDAKEYDSTAFTTVVFYVGKNQTYANTYSTSSVRVNAASPGSGTNTDAFAMNVAIFR